MKKLFLIALVFSLAGLAYSGSVIAPQPSGQTVSKAQDLPQGESQNELSVSPKTVLGGNTQTLVQRGQSWWPYSTPLPPYTPELKKTEEMSVDEIRINDLAMVNIQKPELALAAMPKDLLLPSGAQLTKSEGFYLIKISGLSRTKDQLDELQAAGAVLGEYLHINTYIAMIPSSSLGSVRALPFVTYVGDYHPAYKISPQIGLNLIPTDEAIDPVTHSANPWLFELQVHAGAYVEDVVNDLHQMGIFPEAKDIVTSVFDSSLTTIFVRTAPQTVPQLAKIAGVKFIAEHAYPRLLASSTYPTAIPMVLQNNGVYTSSTATGWKLWNQGVNGNASGTPQIVTVMDSGLATSAYHFAQSTTTVGTPSGSHRKVVAYDNYGGDLCVTAYSNTVDGGHGTWTSQHAVGSISNMTSNPDTTHTPNTYYDNGIAPMAKLYFQDVGTASGITPPTDLGPSITAAIGKGSYITSISWGGSSNTYDTQTTDLDAALFSNQGYLVTVSAGNAGVTGTSTIGTPSGAKNAICVGGVDASVPNSVFEDCTWDGSGACASTDAGSSRGPGPSSRTKPDILAYFYNTGTLGNETAMVGDQPHAECQSAPIATYWDWNNAVTSGGTSFASPDVAGSAALVRDYFAAGFYPGGSLGGSSAVTASGTLVKAMILASGEPMGTSASPSTTCSGCAAIGARPSSDQGWGRINLPSVMHFGSGAPYLWVQNNDHLNSTQIKSFNYTLLGNATPLKIMMVWYDTAGSALVNDLDLTVTIGANTYLGNHFTGGWSSTGGSKDATNPQEGVFLNAASGLPASGSVTVQVAATNAPSGSYYSLVVVGNVVDNNSAPQGALDKGVYQCHSNIIGTIVDSGGTPTNAVFHSTTGGAYPVAISGTSPNFTLPVVTTDQLGAVDGDDIWMTFIGHDSVAYTTTHSKLRCSMNISVIGAEPLTGGCDNDAYMDKGETLLVYPILQNNETFSTMSDFTADLVVDPAFNDANVLIVKGHSYFPAINPGGVSEPDPPFQVRYTGAGTGPITVHFLVQNIQAIDGSWSGSIAASRTFLEYANANAVVDTPVWVNEGFDGTTFPPTGWASTTNVSGTASWARSTGMTHPTMTPYSGAGLAIFQSYNFSAGAQARLATPTFSLAGAVLPKISFYMTHDLTYSSQDNIQVQVATDGGTAYTTLGTFIRITGGTTAGNWQKHIVDLSAYIGQTNVRIGFLGTSAYGDNMSIDNINVANFNLVNDSSVCSGAPIIAWADGDWNFNDDRCNNSSDMANWVPSLDAGESGDLLVYLSNSGNEVAYNVQGTLTCPSCPTYVTLCKTTATWGDIPYGTSFVYGPGDNGFEIALGTNAVSGADLPFIVTLTATGYTPPVVNMVSSPHTPFDARVGTATIQGSCVSPYIAETGTTTDVWYDNFTAAPISVGTTGRCGPDWGTLNWTTVGTITATTTSTPTGDNYAARMTLTSVSTTSGSIARNFNTTGYDSDVQLHFYLGAQTATTAALYLDYTPDGTTYYNLIGGNVGAGTATNSWYYVGPDSVWQMVAGSTGTGFGVAAANAILNNPNFGLRIRGTRSGTTGSQYFWMDDVEVDAYKFVNKATTCTGVCLPPDAPAILSIDDLDACNQTGFTIYYNGSWGAASYDLLKDSTPVVTGILTGATYNPGDSLSHTYVIRANNASGSTNSAGVVFTDGAQPAVTITSITDNNPAVQDGIHVYYTSTAAVNDLYKNAGLVVPGYVSGALYNPGDTSTYTYTVRAALGGCTKTSSGYPFADAATVSAKPGVVKDTTSGGGQGGLLTKIGSNLGFNWTAAAGTCVPTDYEIYMGTLGSYYSHASLTCTTSGGTSYSAPTILTDSNNYYFLVVSATASAEGSYGTNSSNVEIPQAGTPCKTQDLTACNP